MATRPYPPYQQPLVEPKTGVVTRAWQLFFLSLLPARALDDLDGLGLLQALHSPRLLGRGSDGVGPVEELTIGAGLALTALDLHATATGISGLGYWTPITNGDPLSPEILFDAEGDCVVGFVPTPVTP